MDKIKSWSYIISINAVIYQFGSLYPILKRDFL